MSDSDGVAGEILNLVVSHGQRLGRFERVNSHEPDNRPGHGLTAAAWVDRIDPLPRVSGLAVTSARLTLKARLYSSVDQHPRDAIDPNVTAAAWALIRSLVADLRLGVGREIDVLGAHGVALFAQAGYVEWDEGEQSRVIDVTIPIIVYDVWPQEEAA